MPGTALEEALADSELRETTGLVETAPPGLGQAEVLLHESPEGALTWHRPGETALVADGADRVRRFVFDVVDRAVEAFETRARPHRLNVFPDGVEADLPTLAAQGRMLLLVHGTASTAASGFGAMPDALLATLTERYGGRVVAFEHPTLSVTPAANIAWLAERLGTDRVPVDLLAHSRGGLVCRLLAEQPGLTGGRLDVGRTVLVAAPNAGTALADDARLGQLLDRLTTLADRLPGHLGRPVLDLLLRLVQQVVVGVLDGLDGLAAMDPGGPFLTEELNKGAPDRSGYAAVGADYEPRPGSALARVALDGLSDVVFGDVANDLVVPTDGCYDVPGLDGFPVADRLVFAAADAVDHNGYWTRAGFGERLLEWLDPS
ncbi:esterase/lipase family protein [Nocardioides iriomotensis]|uniref:DUF7379 domain-containing protein n=1 Tax=Nocardioides iriomotensis TaxID=715784 RepID=A0A4Q5J8H0_9ACTN|nr:hypothetical protein [Nocardioides iriomotensis]RYU14218.1 hypothetical protein ETU37_04765 [Nocardioides iriomotensis]